MHVQTIKFDFKVLIYRDPQGIYIAQCLNYDLVTHGESVSAVLNSLQRIIHTQIKVSLDDDIEPFSDFEPAPAEFWQRYNELDREQRAFVFGSSAKRPFSGEAVMKLAA